MRPLRKTGQDEGREGYRRPEIERFALSGDELRRIDCSGDPSAELKRIMIARRPAAAHG